MAVPYTFATATSSIPLSELDTNFATAITLGNTAVYLGNTTTSIGNLTLTNTTISSVATTFPNSFLANSSVTLGTTNVSLGGTATTLANLTLSNVTISSGTSTATQNLANVTGTLAVANGGTGLNSLSSGYIPYGNGTSAFSSSSNLTFSGSTLTVSGAASVLNLNGSSFGQVISAQSLYLDAGSTGAIYIRPNGSTQAAVFSSAGYLGIGTSSPNQPLHVVGIIQSASSTNYLQVQQSGADGYINMTGSGNTYFRTGSYFTQTMAIDSSGNLGLGVTPSAWFSGTPAMQYKYYGSIWNASDSTFHINENAYYNGSNWVYLTSTQASNYYQGSGTHVWRTAPSGTAGTNISFTQAMTLDNSGNLLVGQTSVSQTTVGAHMTGNGNANPGTISSVLSASTNSVTSYNLYSTGASAYRFYVDMAGTIHATSTSITAISDQSLKTNIKPLETGLAEVMKLQPRRFDWTEESKNEAKNVAGFIAQEVETVLPDLVAPFKYNDEETKLGLKMGDMIPTLVKAIQELSEEVNQLKQKLGV